MKLLSVILAFAAISLVFGEECKDNQKYCPDWAGAGHCKSNPGYMLENCKKSCNVCTGGGGGGDNGGKDNGGKDNGGKDNGGNDPDCKDSHENCESWAKRGECRNNPGWMLDNCKKSCDCCKGGKCGKDENKGGGNNGECADTKDQCQEWSQGRECEYNSRWMLDNCRKACKNCGNIRKVDPKDKSCKDDNESCLFYAIEGECQLNPGWMHSACPYSCSKCGSCRDLTPKCEKYAQDGWCTKNPVYMADACRKSCRIC